MLLELIFGNTNDIKGPVTRVQLKLDLVWQY